MVREYSKFRSSFKCPTFLFAGRHMSRNTMLLPSATEQIQEQFFSAFPQIDANALNDIEIEAQYLAANLDGITENLANLLHSVNNSPENEILLLILIHFMLIYGRFHLLACRFHQ